MTIPEIVVISLVGAAFAAGIIYFLINRRKLMFPEGDYLEYTSPDGYKVHLIADGPIFSYPPTTFIKVCATAAFVLDKAWGQAPRKGNIKEFVVMFKTKDRFTYHGKKNPNVQAYLTTCPYKIGRGYIPMAVIRDKHIPTIHINGEPLIHELCHELLGEHMIERGGGHEEPDVWARFGENTIQHRAHEMFIELNKV